MYTFRMTKISFANNQDEFSEALENYFPWQISTLYGKNTNLNLARDVWFPAICYQSLHRGEGSFEQRRSDFNPIGTCNSCSIPAVPAKQNWQIVLSSKSKASGYHKFQTKDAATFSSMQLLNVSTQNQYAQCLQRPIYSLTYLNHIFLHKVLKNSRCVHHKTVPHNSPDCLQVLYHFSCVHIANR